MIFLEGIQPLGKKQLIEVANSSLALDRSKGKIYASAKIPEYWIVNLIENQIEVYRNPSQSDYRDKMTYKIDEECNTLLDIKFTIRLSNLIG